MRILGRDSNGKKIKNNIFYPNRSVTAEEATAFIRRELLPFKADINAGKVTIQAIATEVLRCMDSGPCLQNVKDKTGIEFGIIDPKRELELCAKGYWSHLELAGIFVHFGGKSTEFGRVTEIGNLHFVEGLNGDCRGSEDCAERMADAIQRVDRRSTEDALILTGNVMCEIGFMLNGAKGFQDFIMLDAEKLRNALIAHRDNPLFLDGGQKRTAQEIKLATEVLIGFLERMDNIQTVVISRANARSGLLCEMVDAEQCRLRQSFMPRQSVPGGPT